MVWENRELRQHPEQKDLNAEPGTERAADGQSETQLVGLEISVEATAVQHCSARYFESV